MIRFNRKTRFVALAAVALSVMTLISGGALKARAAEEEDAKVALSADQFIASIRAAVKAKPGKVVSVEAETEKGATKCDVTILARDGKTYEVAVSPSNGKVLEIEAGEKDGEEKEDGKEADEKDEAKEGPDKD